MKKVRLDSPDRTDAFYSTIEELFRALQRLVVDCGVSHLNSNKYVSVFVRNLLLCLESLATDGATEPNANFPRLHQLRETPVINISTLLSDRTSEISGLLYSPSFELRCRLVQDLETCNDAIRATKGKKSRIPDDPTTLHILEDVKAVREWLPARSFCDIINNLHSSFMTKWQCNRNVRHVEARLSFSLPCRPRDESAYCTVYFPHSSGRPEWQRGEIQMSQNGLSQVIGGSQGGPPVEHLQSLCELPRWSNAIMSVDSGQAVLVGLPPDPAPPQIRSDIIQMSSLTQILNARSLKGHRKVNGKERLVLALVLAYAYLHLSGGPWWPDETVDPDTWFRHDPTTGSVELWHPFVGIKIQSEQSSQSESSIPYRYELLNSRRPNLPAFGKLLLEIWAGRPVAFDSQMDRERAQCRSEMGGEIFLCAVDACLNRKGGPMKYGGPLSQNQPMREFFVDRVIKTL